MVKTPFMVSQAHGLSDQLQDEGVAFILLLDQLKGVEANITRRPGVTVIKIGA